MGKMSIFVEIGKIYNHINESNKILTKISRKIIRIRIWKKSFDKIKVFKLYYQNNIAIIIKHANL